MSENDPRENSKQASGWRRILKEAILLTLGDITWTPPSWIEKIRAKLSLKLQDS